jgi:hypothetical protein
MDNRKFTFLFLAGLWVFCQVLNLSLYLQYGQDVRQNEYYLVVLGVFLLLVWMNPKWLRTRLSTPPVPQPKRDKGGNQPLKGQFTLR